MKVAHRLVYFGSPPSLLKRFHGLRGLGPPDKALEVVVAPKVEVAKMAQKVDVAEV